MYRLSNDLAKRRLLYPSPLISAPSVLVIELPVSNRGTGLPLGRYYPIILETEYEIEEIQRFLDQPRQEPVRPDIFDARPSRLRSDHVLVSRYDPPVPGWPWVSVCRWPNNFTKTGTSLGAEMARGCYTMELFVTEADLDASQAAVVANLADRHELNLRLLSADALHCAGEA